MRTLAKILMAVGLALAVSTTASATISVSLVDNGTGDYVAGVGGTTLGLDIIISGDGLGPEAGMTGVFVDLTYDASILAGSGVATEGAFHFVNGVVLTPLGAAFGDTGSVMTGWDASTLTPPGVAGAFSFTLGTVTFGLGTGNGVISVAGPGLAIGDEAFNNIAGVSNLGTFSVLVPEPTTASLLGLGLLGLTVAGRNRKN